MQHAATSDLKDHMAVVKLAKQFMSYGFDDRALPLLSLAQWLAPEEDGIQRLRVRALARLQLWQEAHDLMLTYLAKHFADEEDHLCLANILWALGEKEQGDAAFLKVFFPQDS